MSTPVCPLNLTNRLLIQPNQGQFITESYFLIIRHIQGIAIILISTHFPVWINNKTSSVLVNSNILIVRQSHKKISIDINQRQ
jgi:hypothetical protein